MSCLNEKIFNQENHKDLRQKLRNNRSYSEKLLWMKIRNNQIGFKFRRQHGIGQYIVDFYCSEIKLIIEIDGATHSTDEELLQDDIRESFFRSLGLNVKRYYNKDVKKNMNSVLEDLIIYCEKLHC